LLMVIKSCHVHLPCSIKSLTGKKDVQVSNSQSQTSTTTEEVKEASTETLSVQNRSGVLGKSG
jgi:hypothetical protein